MHQDELKHQLQLHLRQFIRLIRLRDAVMQPDILKKIAENIVHLKETASRVHQSKSLTDELRTNAKIIENMMLQELEADGVEASYYQAARHLIDSDNPDEMKKLVKELLAFSSAEERYSLIDHFAHIAENPDTTLD
jgi:hypothetical protein